VALNDFDCENDEDDETKKQAGLVDRIRRLQRKLINKAGPSKQSLYAIYHLIVNQVKMSYGWRDLVASSFKCLCCRSTRRLKRLHGENKAEFYYRKGEEKLNKDLNIVNMIEMMKGFRVMKQVLFDQNQLFFLNFQQRDVILTDTD